MANKQFTKGLEADREETGILTQVMEQDINEMILGTRGVGVISSGLLVKPNSPSDNTVLVEAGKAFDGTTYIDLTSQTQSGTFAVVSSTKERWDMVTLYDNSGTPAIRITQGTEADVGNALPPDIIENEICLAFVYINETVTVDILSDDISDRRVFIKKDFWALIDTIPLITRCSRDHVDHHEGSGTSDACYVSKQTSGYEDIDEGGSYDGRFHHDVSKYSDYTEVKYKLAGRMRSHTASNPCYIRLYNVTDAAAVTNSEAQTQDLQGSFPEGVLSPLFDLDDDDNYKVEMKSHTISPMSIWTVTLNIYANLAARPWE